MKREVNVYASTTIDKCMKRSIVSQYYGKYFPFSVCSAIFLYKLYNISTTVKWQIYVYFSLASVGTSLCQLLQYGCIFICEPYNLTV